MSPFCVSCHAHNVPYFCMYSMSLGGGRDPSLNTAVEQAYRNSTLWVCRVFLWRACSILWCPQSRLNEDSSLLNATVCLAFLVYQGPKMKSGSCCGESKTQFSGPTLRSLANFYIEFEQFTVAVHFQRQKPVYGTSGPTKNHRVLKCFSKLHSWPTDPIFVGRNNIFMRVHSELHRIK